MNCYDRSGIPITLVEWGQLRESDPGYFRINEDILVIDDEPVQVSTVWLGLDHSLGLGELPVIFETMVFGGKDSQYCQRYCTEDEAKAGHTEIVVALTAGLRLLDEG